MKRKLIFLLAALVITASFLELPAIAGNIPTAPGMEPLYDSVQRIGGSLTIASSGEAECLGYVRAVSSGNKVYLTMTLQRYTNSSWSNVTSWFTTGRETTDSLSKTYSVPSGYNYRLKVVVTVYAHDGTFVSQETLYSPSEYY